MTKDELAYWLSVTENSRFKWTEDAIFRLNGRGSFHYTGGEDGIYMKIEKDGLLEGGTYEGAIPHIGDAMFTPAATKQCANYSEAFTAAMEAGGKQFLLDMFSADAPAIPPQEAPERKPAIRARIANADDMASMFSDIDRLKDGSFASTWHDFPTTTEKVQAALKEIGVDGVKHAAYFIGDYETDIPGLRDRLPVGANIDELNMLAVILSEMTGHERETFGAVMLAGRHCNTVMDMVNVADCLELFDLQPAQSAKEYGEFLANVEYDVHADAITRLENTNEEGVCALPSYIERLEKYFDAAAYAQDVIKAENGVFTEYGYLTESEGFNDVYEKEVPPEYRVFTFPGRKEQERPSVLDKLAAAKEAVARADAEKPPADKAAKSPDAEL